MLFNVPLLSPAKLLYTELLSFFFVVPDNTWYLGCYKLQSNNSVTLLEWFEGYQDGYEVSGYYRNYTSEEPPPVYGSRHCSGKQ